jgi:hypothetical protein
MPDLSVRWSETEARKPYARPFMVTFLDDDGGALGSIAVSGADLLYYRQFQAAVLGLAGELFSDAAVDVAADPQRVWLDRVARLLPDAGLAGVTPCSSFDEHEGRRFMFSVVCGAGSARVDAPSLLEYQEFQAVIAHQTGCLFRDPDVEAVEDPQARQAAWIAGLRGRTARPDPAEALTATWPWP